MVRQPASKASSGRSPLAFLLQMDGTAIRRPSSPWLIWISIIVVWLASLLPWRLWEPAPDLLLLVLAFWCLNEPHRVGLFTAFFFGLLMDVHDAGLLGAHALAYTLVAYGAITLHRRLQRFNAVVQALHMLPVFFFAETATRLMHAWLMSEWAGWQWIWSVLFTVVLWPLADILLLVQQRHLDAVDSGQQ